MDSTVKAAIIRCKELLDVIETDKELITDIAKQFALKTIHLRTTAEVITNVLHKNNNNAKKLKRKLEESDDEESPKRIKTTDEEDDVNFLTFDSQVHEESKTTRRNAHYKSTVYVIMYYLIYYSYFGKAPKYVGYRHIIQNKNNKARQFLENNPDLLKLLYTEKQLKKYSKVSRRYKFNKIEVKTPNDDIEYRPIQHPNTFKQYTYNYKLANVFDGAMPDLIKFGYKNFNDNCKKFIAINLVIKHKEKIKYENEKRKKKKPVRFTLNDTTSVLDDDCDSNEDIIKKEYMEDNPLVNQYKHLTIEELKLKLKEPSVLLKFYQAFLLECDWEMLFQYLSDLLSEGSCHATMTKLLIYLVWNVTKIVCIANEREGQNRNLDILLKQYKYREVISQLQIWANKYKYSMYDLPQQQLSMNTKAFDLKTFKELARNTKHMYFHITSNPVKLENNEVEFPNICTLIKYIDYAVDGCNKVIFDLVQITKTDTNTKIDLSKSSWKDRLDMLERIYIQAGRKENIAKITETNIRVIQFDKLPCGSSVCHYLKTGGVGIGTLFFSASNRRQRQSTNMPNKRFKKTTLDDLKERILGVNSIIPVEQPYASQSPFYVTDYNQFQQQTQSIQSYQQLFPPLSSIINDLITGGILHINNQQNTNTTTQQQDTTIPTSQTPSPCQSPTHDLSLSYLGSLQSLNNNAELQFTEFKEEDDI
ncbi:hypothetical protein QKT26_gp29 [Carcinus maenas nudivirus]|uniref:Uncharacterized protein n=1 Tax=Carcinus maenas nudivirus TaxID=2880837 RepID=A0AAE9BYU3_9VIRU|nr:hypothetical protein QKT26_gp29 [Carcinus maenas nudivirus]UBZ25619.1 hypothetical protein CmNV_029 [Carcinus maenas nudivirus]